MPIEFMWRGTTGFVPCKWLITDENGNALYVYAAPF